MIHHNIRFFQAKTTVLLQLRHTLLNSQKLLFWAVTGAGKTEVLVPILEEFLFQGKQVLWCAPRKDVVIEIWQSVKSDFS
jgi:competence protein ComFA